MTITGTRIYALTFALLLALLTVLAVPALMSRAAPAAHGTSFTTSQPDNPRCYTCGG
jgi:hypothetical protein